MYCGNNADHTDLLSGKLILGDRYGCLRKGIGRGNHQPMDPNYLGPYSPIDQRKVYCGQSGDLPDGYDLMGNLPQCLQKGMGIGKRQRALRGDDRNIFKRHIKIFLLVSYLIMIAVTFSMLYFIKPSWIMRVDEKGISNIDIRKFIPIYITICMGLLVFTIGLWYQSE